MHPSPARDEILDALSKVNRKMRTMFDARVREHGLTLSRARTLLRIAEGQAVNQKELAEELEIENATLVRLIDGLESQGLIERREVETDRRAKQVVMTGEGEEVVKLVNQMAIDLRCEILAGLDEDEIAEALAFMRKMTRNIEEAS
jgi:MarR family transcriptional regulator for hemolysin